MKQWYEILFANYGIKYDNENFPKGRRQEFAFYR